MDRTLLRSVTAGEWPVALVERSGLWPTRGLPTLILLPPALGPSATMLLHRLAYTHPTRWTTDDLADQLGLAPSRIVDALARTTQFHLVHVNHGTIEVPSRLGPLPSRLLDQLPTRLRRVHELLVAGQQDE